MWFYPGSLQDVPNYILVEVSLLAVTDGVMLMGRFFSVRLEISKCHNAVYCVTDQFVFGCTLLGLSTAGPVVEHCPSPHRVCYVRMYMCGVWR